MEPKKNANMVMRLVGETLLLSCILFFIIVYLLQSYGYVKPFETWLDGVKATLSALIVVAIIATSYGFFQGYRLKRRIELLRESMLLLEKGNLSRPMPDLGEDEIGQLADQLGRVSKRWEEQVTSLQRLSTNNAQLAEQARISAIIEERQRLARELHDAVSQQLFAISMTATAVRRTLDKDFDRAERQVELIEEMASVAQSEMRALLLHLRPVHLEGKGLAQGIAELIRELQSKIPIEILCEMDEHIELVKGVENHLFRIVQEALSNTLRHSKATRMEIKLQNRDDFVRLFIRDNGVGFDWSDKKQASYGLRMMQERINEVGGSIQFITAPDKGTRIEIRVPVVKEESGLREEEGSDGNGSIHDGDTH
ncbi:sensor histidine kinase [Paenibacillus profundus]|uniref:Sensor histidine kinase n=1 Tax=Paenibacillus profundus TaxID=1173085 RepID=A0ABS8YI28_9BACL|nr:MULTISPECIES: sensor histidine kinase [Paenibacillus]MCE5171583.1 sensor histidine kinase [Paenibacillus profundus]MCM3338855.1 sensor histidine kinase [Paenibacillus sp. MER TA 81-3]